MEKPTIQNANVLLVEDNPADQKLTIRALNKGRVKTNLYIVEDGVEAMNYLEHKDKYTDRQKFPLPDLILLDINLPRMNGLDVLKKIRQDAELKTIPIIMLTTSSQEKDIVESYKLGVNAYINKPVQINDFTSAIRTIEDFWFCLTILPTN